MKWFRGQQCLPSGLHIVKQNSFEDKPSWLAAEGGDCQVIFGKRLDSDWLHVFEYPSFAHVPSWWQPEEGDDS